MSFDGADIMLSIAQIVPCTEAEGPGRRFALWFQGCPLRCPGCCNPEMLPFEGGRQLPAAAVVALIDEARERDAVEGITLLGGEPLAHALPASILAAQARERGLSVMVFSGYLLEEAQAMADPAVHELLRRTDILVDGPYDRTLPETQRRWIGSSNQRIHFLSDRYRADDECWRRPNTLEIRLVGSEMTVNGFPMPLRIADFGLRIIKNRDQEQSSRLSALQNPQSAIRNPQSDDPQSEDPQSGPRS